MAAALNAPPKLPTPASTAGPWVRSDGGAHLLDGARALVDVDTGGGVRAEPRADRSPADVAAHLLALEGDLARAERRRCARASRRSAPSPVTASTRPPVTRSPSVPAGKTMASGWSASSGTTSARSTIGAPSTGAPGSRPQRRPRCTPPRSRTLDRRSIASPPVQHARAMSARSLSSSGRTACASGSPKRQLNSSSRGPSGVSIRPA